ncbi:methyltransferase domain-containing protein [Stieleria sp. JC731]|uniref:methyltransferase domain-containing protein n=1 Tax=Pirellulaceae TaxID=2691357 RepID=UPI001E5531CC|nr:methyltransferase domain-containing protein [Stieleria sp. JC731]MCC9599652.1 methyltransferase domain-containing protein [Stieleria sp. JC731]
MNMLNTESAVRERYSSAAAEREPALCCPVDYDRRYLEIIPQEVIDRDYGCGDPSKYVREGETVLDLGSGGGKICFIAAQIVGAEGRVIGVDMNDEMLELARQSQPAVAEQMGYDNLEFRKGKIQDLAIDRDRVDEYLKASPVTDEASFQQLEKYLHEMRTNAPLIPSDSIDVIVSNCVLNLVDASEKPTLFAELFRVLKPGGRAVISDIVSDKLVPDEMQQDATLWSGCISGALQEKAFIDAFANVGFQGIQIAVYQSEPWQTVQGIEFRSVTVIAYKLASDESDSQRDGQQTELVYRGPYASIEDDAGNRFVRGERTEVSRETLEAMQGEPYANDFITKSPGFTSDVESQPMKTFTIGSSSSDSCCGNGGCC